MTLKPKRRIRPIHALPKGESKKQIEARLRKEKHGPKFASRGKLDDAFMLVISALEDPKAHCPKCEGVGLIPAKTNLSNGPKWFAAPCPHPDCLNGSLHRAAWQIRTKINKQLKDQS